MSQAHEDLRSKLADLGYPYRMIPIEVLSDLQREIAARKRDGRIDGELSRRYLPSWTFEAPTGARSIIVLAVPRHWSRVYLTWDGVRRSVVIPPTYVGYRGTKREIESCIKGILGPFGHSATTVDVPLKLLAARSGLVRYGRNNITYIPGMGSFFQLGACFSDLEPEPVFWGEPEVLERCRNCRACAKACPTQIIGSDGFAIDAARCLTFHNESASPMPPWIPRGSHRCMIGCMECQALCPENRTAMKVADEMGELNEAETRAIACRQPDQELPSQAARVLERLQLSEEREVLARNLRLLFAT